MVGVLGRDACFLTIYIQVVMLVGAIQFMYIPLQESPWTSNQRAHPH